tara:strand:- start:324 stop:1052 length:729 start_codon:yes stop_codon:yes gene_type:complete
MRYILILFLVFNISNIKADEIYNLLKIPNLEVYKLKSNNKIRYLNSNNDFKIGLNDNITCKKASKIKLEEKFPTIEENLSLYNSLFLNKIKLKYVVLCENLFISEINTGGIPDTKNRTLILDINFDPKYFERMIHHEIFHMIQKSYKDIFDEVEFSNLNDDSFQYAECSTCSNRLNLDLYNDTKGFLTEYSKSIPSEDMAEIFSFLMTDKNKINKIIQTDTILKNKVDLIRNGLSKIDNNIL